MVVTVHLEAKTTYLCMVLKNAGANVVVTGSNPLSTQDDVAAARLMNTASAKRLVTTRPRKNMTSSCTGALDTKPHIIIDDGGDLKFLCCTANAPTWLPMSVAAWKKRPPACCALRASWRRVA